MKKQLTKFKNLSKGKKVAIIVGGAILFVAMFGYESTDVTTSETQTQTSQTVESVDVVVESTKEEVIEEKPTMMKSGMYKVGSEIESGIYYIEADYGLGYVASLKNTTGELGSIINNDTVSTHTFIEVKDGEYLEVSGSHFCKADEVDPMQPDENGILGEGMYRVGIDLPEGEYKVTANEDSFMAYVGVLDNVYGDIGSISNNDILDGDTYITVKNGQFLELSGASIKVK